MNRGRDASIASSPPESASPTTTASRSRMGLHAPENIAGKKRASARRATAGKASTAVIAATSAPGWHSMSPGITPPPRPSMSTRALWRGGSACARTASAIARP